MSLHELESYHPHDSSRHLSGGPDRHDDSKRSGRRLSPKKSNPRRTHLGRRAGHLFPTATESFVAVAETRLHYLQEKGHLENEKVRMIILTASDRPHDQAEALWSGAISYIIKSPAMYSITNLVHRFCLR